MSNLFFVIYYSQYYTPSLCSEFFKYPDERCGVKCCIPYNSESLSNVLEKKDFEKLLEYKSEVGYWFFKKSIGGITFFCKNYKLL